MADPDLSLLVRLVQNLTDEVVHMRDELRVQGAILMRVDTTVSGLVNELRATHTQMSRFDGRLRRLEDSRPES